MVFVGRPIYYIEVVMGQYAQCGPIRIWNCAPAMRGTGVGMVIVSTLVAVYYIMIMVYSIFFMKESFKGIYGELPWTYCGNVL